MTLITVALVILVVGLIVWLAVRQVSLERRRNAPEFTQDQRLLVRSLIQEKIDRLEKERQQIIDDSARRGVKISTDEILKQAEELRETYVKSGQEEEAREVERVIREFREQHGSEIPIDEAFRMMKEFERKRGE